MAKAQILELVVQILELIIGIVMLLSFIRGLNHTPQNESEHAARGRIISFFGAVLFLSYFVLDCFFSIKIIAP